MANLSCTALLVEFGHECPVIFDPAGFAGTLGRPVGCRAATRGRTAKRAVLSIYCKLEYSSDVGSGGVNNDGHRLFFFLSKVFLFCCKSRTWKN